MTSEQRRMELIRVKRDATWLTFAELDGLINLSALARQYFKKSQGWLMQRINNYVVRGKRMKFKEEEYLQLSKYLRDIARRLETHADEIDAAAMETDPEE